MRTKETAEGRSVRLLRVGEQVRHVLSEILQRGDVHDEVLATHPVSVTEVRMSPDLRHATVFVKPLLGHDEEAVIKALRTHTAYLQREVAGRVLERGFKKQFGFNPFMWSQFDSRFRMIISRRNIILLIMTLGLALGVPAEAFVLSAAWSILSVVVQGLRYFQAVGQSRRGPLRTWLG